MRNRFAFNSVIFAAVLVFTTLQPERAVAQPRPTDVISVNVLDAIDGFFNLGWEHTLGDSWSFYLGAEVLAFRGVFDDYPGSVVGIGPALGLNLYLLGDAPQGLWLGPYAVGSWVSVSNGGDSATRFGYALGGRIGASVLLGALHLSAGIGFLWRDFAVNLNESDLGPRGFRPRFELAIGVAF